MNHGREIVLRSLKRAIPYLLNYSPNILCVFSLNLLFFAAGLMKGLEKNGKDPAKSLSTFSDFSCI